ncbi:MAG: tetraacyldisaccharide 4'-kinase [Acidobacteria bacterium]|nr:tetraacyldisaccharide 4'-kinase [Acidobacteriota bacterium]
MTYFAYNLLAALAAIVAVPYDLIRGLKRGRSWSSLAQRLGYLPHLFHQTSADAVWLHAVSVGEVVSCERLIRQWKGCFPAVPIFVSTSTASGQALAREKLGDVVAGVFYAPLDLPFAVRRVLDTIRPRLLIVAETEIWPNLYRQTKQAGAGLLVVNGRISDQAFPSYRRFRFLFRSVLRHVDVLLAQSEQDRQRMIAIGAASEKVVVGGNLKYDFEPAATTASEDLKGFLAGLGARPVVVAGSTREGEERLVVEAFREVTDALGNALLVVAPRHPQRFDEVAAELAGSEFPVIRRSALKGDSRMAGAGILLLDSLGELSSLYSHADAVFVGGTLNGWGGHNVLEPALSGCPVVVGPAMQNFAEIASTLLAEQGVVQVGSGAELGSALVGLLRDKDSAAALADRGRRVAEKHRGATERALAAAARLYGDAVPVAVPGWGRRALLAGPALLWGAVARRRAGGAGAGAGSFGGRRLKAFTLCVGNLTAGGEGKTPTVAWLVEALWAQGYQPAVLTRGYRRKSKSRLVIAEPGVEPVPADVGDEAYLLWRRFSDQGMQVPIGVGADRYQVGCDLEARFAVDVIVLDDGYQHFALERDFDLLIVDASRPFGGGRLLPLGLLREPCSGASRARVILLTKTQKGLSYEGIERELRRWNVAAPICRARTKLASFVDANSGEEIGPDTLIAKSCFGFCGLGSPDSFWRSLEGARISVRDRMEFADHHSYSRGDVRRMIEAARRAGADTVLTTEKDLVNLRRAADASGGAAQLFEPLRLFWARIEQEVDPDLLKFIADALPKQAKAGRGSNAVVDVDAKAAPRTR